MNRVSSPAFSTAVARKPVRFGMALKPEDQKLQADVQQTLKTLECRAKVQTVLDALLRKITHHGVAKTMFYPQMEKLIAHAMVLPTAKLANGTEEARYFLEANTAVAKRLTQLADVTKILGMIDGGYQDKVAPECMTKPYVERMEELRQAAQAEVSGPLHIVEQKKPWWARLFNNAAFVASGGTVGSIEPEGPKKG